MENIEFEEKSIKNNFQDFYKKPKGLVNFLIEKKIFKDEKTAAIFLLSIATVLILSAGVLAYNTFKTEKEIPFNEMTPEMKAKLPQLERSILENLQKRN